MRRSFQDLSDPDLDWGLVVWIRERVRGLATPKLRNPTIPTQILLEDPWS